MAALIRDRLGVDYHVDHVGRLLHALGWSPQKPARRALKCDEEAIARWIEEEWPRVKKRRVAFAGGSLVRKDGEGYGIAGRCYIFPTRLMNSPRLS